MNRDFEGIGGICGGSPFEKKSYIVPNRIYGTTKRYPPGGFNRC